MSVLRRPDNTMFGRLRAGALLLFLAWSTFVTGAASAESRQSGRRAGSESRVETSRGAGSVKEAGVDRRNRREKVTAPEGSSRKQVAGWGEKRTLNDHYRRHGQDFGAQSSAEYVQKSQAFFRERGRHLQKVDAQGTIRVYEPGTNTFASYNRNGTTKTFFKPNPAVHEQPTNMHFWEAQPGKSP